MGTVRWVFSETDATTYYLFLGRSHSWDNRRWCSIILLTEQTFPFILNDDVNSEFYNYDDMIRAKIFYLQTSHVIPRRNWTTGTTYDKYEHNISSSNSK